MSVALEPPLTRSMPQPGSPVRQAPLATAPRYLRTAGMGRWHRPRSAIEFAYPWSSGGHVSYQFWCGAGAGTGKGRLLRAEAVPAGELACGTCEGRAAGAGQDDWPGETELVFSPRRLAPPAKCPGSRKERLALQVNDHVMRCLACGELVPGRCSGSPYRSIYGPVNHKPGPGLVHGCPFHAWDYLVVHGGRAACSCQAEGDSLL